jgi:sulfur relay (sulfurtransferase) DsrC/TusE family protein
MTTQFELTPDVETSASHQPWSEEYAQKVALRDGIGQLSEAHWCIIHTLRNHFIQYGAIPPMHLACSVNNLEPHCVEHLFHDAREAWILAGLPDPGDEMRYYS